MPRAGAISLIGDRALLRKLDRLSKRGAKRAVSKAVRAGATVTRRAVKAATPTDQGLLKKAQDSKLIGRGLSRGAVIGANVDKLKADHQADPARPTNIDWLVEYGHVAPNGTHVPPSGHMRRAAAESRGPAIAAMESKLATEIEREALAS